MQSGSREFLSHWCQQHAICRQGQVIDTGDVCQSSHEVGQMLVEQWLAAGQPHLTDAEASSDTRNFENFLIAQALAAAQELEVRMKLILGHAIRTTEIALV
jgi:flagellum-specific peptidoglycan hydrolase FlgJ